MENKLKVVVAAREMLTPQICQFELRHADGDKLPPFEAGAHIVVETPSGIARSYSLVNHEAEADRYVIAVKRENGGRGGSVSMHADTAPGDILRISPPTNSFGFMEAPKYLLVAGGIGITPIMSMFRRLLTSGHKDFRLVYCTRSAESTPYLDELTAPAARNLVTIHHTSTRNGSRFDFWPMLKKPDGRHVYYCGPTSMMDALYARTIHWPRSAIHFEDFAGISATGVNSKPFQVRRLATDDVFEIPADRSVVDVLRNAGLKPKSSCESGTCGTCRVRLISGEPDHRDLVLTAEERESFFMPCVSRALSGEITLDI